LVDDAELGRDALRNNDFQYDKDPQSQERCPFAAHTRKTNPRADLNSSSTETHRIMRRGIQFGPELTEAEVTSNKTIEDRGLLFVSYQSNIANGFRFLQESRFFLLPFPLLTIIHMDCLLITCPGWANNKGFPFKNVEPGFDAIIGAAIGATDQVETRTISGTNPNDTTAPLSLTQDWVVPKGGGYFFSPSIPALRETFALAG
jgi:deferrochelatase/peroxidase EfeB